MQAAMTFTDGLASGRTLLRTARWEPCCKQRVLAREAPNAGCGTGQRRFVTLRASTQRQVRTLSTLIRSAETGSGSNAAVWRRTYRVEPASVALAREGVAAARRRRGSSHRSDQRAR